MTERFTYDGQGRIMSHTDRQGQITTYEHDALEVTKITRGALTTTIAYNPGYLGRAVTCRRRG